MEPTAVDDGYQEVRSSQTDTVVTDVPSQSSEVAAVTDVVKQPVATAEPWSEQFAPLELLLQHQESIFQLLRERLASLEKPEDAPARQRSITGTGARRLSAQSPTRPSTGSSLPSGAQRTPVQSRPTTAGGPTRVGGYAASPGKPKVTGSSRVSGVSTAASSRRPPTAGKSRQSVDATVAAADSATNELRARSLTRQRSVDRWNVDSRLKELEDIKASNFQAMERTNSAFSRTHSLRKVANQASRGAQVEQANAAADSGDVLSASAMLDGGAPEDAAAAPSYTEYLRRASAVSARKTPRRLSTAKIIAKTPRAAMARIVRAMVVAQGGVLPSSSSSLGNGRSSGASKGTSAAGRGAAPAGAGKASADAKKPQWQSTTKVVAGRAPGAVPAGSRRSAAQRSVS